MALLITRRINQGAVIQTPLGTIRVVVFGVERDRVKLGFIGSPVIFKVLREELLDSECDSA